MVNLFANQISQYLYAQLSPRDIYILQVMLILVYVKSINAACQAFKEMNFVIIVDHWLLKNEINTLRFFVITLFQALLKLFSDSMLIRLDSLLVFKKSQKISLTFKHLMSLSDRGFIWTYFIKVAF